MYPLHTLLHRAAATLHNATMSGVHQTQARSICRCKATDLPPRRGMAFSSGMNMHATTQAQTSGAVTACLDVVLQMTLHWNRLPGPACRVGASSKQTWLPSKLPTLLASWQTLFAGTPPRTGILTPPTPRGALSRSVCHIRYADWKEMETHRLADAL